MKQNKMIRKIGEREDPFQYIQLTRERLQTSYALLDTHIKWFTHKNPHGCSICDLLQLTESILESFESFLGPDPGETQMSPVTSNSTLEGQQALND